MPTIIISGPAQAFAKSPRASKPITDRKTLARFHGLASEQASAELFDQTPLSKIGLSGGRLRFVLDDETSALRIVTTYHVPRRLTEEETQLLVEATTTQWSDGCGSGSFENFYGNVLSTALAKAILNSRGSQEDLGEYFVDAFPWSADEEPRVAFVKADNAEKSDLNYLKEAAAFGEPQAQFQLARQLEEGEGIKTNQRLAFEYYQKAADQGHLSALTFLGLCFQQGTGTAKDLKRGFACFEKAAGEGLLLAMHCLGACYMDGQGVEANPGEGTKWYRRGAKLGDMGCTAELAECHEYGKGVPLDLKKALQLYESCKEGGFDAVEPALKRVKKQLKSSGGK